MRLWPLPILALALACRPGRVSIDEEPIDEEEPVNDEEEEEEEPEEPEEGWSLRGSLVIPAEAEAFPEQPITLTLFDTSPEGCCTPWRQVTLGPALPGETLAFELTLPETPPTELWFTDPSLPDTQLAMFSVGAYIDLNGNGQPDPGDHFIASDVRVLGYVTGEIRPEILGDDAHEGWNDFDLVNGTVRPLSLDGAELHPTPANLLAMAPPSAALAQLTTDAAAGALGGPWVLQLVPVAALTGSTVAQPSLVSLSIDPSGSTYEVPLPHPLPTPPEDHFLPPHLLEIDALDFEAAPYFLILFHDADGDGSWDPLHEKILADSFGPPPSEQAILLRVRATGFHARLVAELSGPLGWGVYSLDAADEGALQRLGWDTPLTAAPSDTF